MMQCSIEAEINLEENHMVEIGPRVVKASANIVVNHTHQNGNYPAYGKKCQKYRKENCCKAVCRSSSSSGDKYDHCWSKFKKGKGKKKYHKVTEGSNDMDDQTDQCNLVFIMTFTLNTRMHTELSSEMSHGMKSV